MREKISIEELGKKAKELASTAKSGKELFVIVDDEGQELAALVPMSLLESYDRSREYMAGLMERAAAANDLSEAEASFIAQEEVAEYRAEKRARREQAG